ncbi:hypothetical protein CCMA1212_005300 [Trichoderma ghanense]|uniref:Uncharacterized protein n=1 Tax=Trichoderma ghanense TaxID=65468 RepID=A0ABY2H332_9HYPO
MTRHLPCVSSSKSQVSSAQPQPQTPVLAILLGITILGLVPADETVEDRPKVAPQQPHSPSRSRSATQIRARTWILLLIALRNAMVGKGYRSCPS